ncbi:citramalate synthase [Candidatus Sumerlaeota bacterium]|nr:citramalate synthase [Candidatus Sumerlaeota bacterium]
MKKNVSIYDTTLRDGEQGEGVNFSVIDKVKVALTLDGFGFDYIEGGWPGSNPKAVEFFKAMREHPLTHAKLAAFSSTRRKNCKAAEDPNLQALLAVKTPVATIFGKTWDLHVREALRVPEDENLRMIADTIKYLRSKRREVIYDAEHFFDGYKADPDFALRTIEAAAEAGASWIVMCDTNGGTMPTEIQDIIAQVKQRINLPLGIHAHNDTGMGVANAVVAVACGCTQVQGTINGYGERCGNSDLVQVIPNLELKYGKRCLPKGHLARLTELSLTIAERANQTPDSRQPYVGRSCFAHKGGIHVSAVRRNKTSYEHVDPGLVGNKTRVLVSEQAGQSNIISKAEELGIDLKTAPDAVRDVLKRIKRLENEGYEFEGAEASFELMMRQALGRKKANFFDMESFRVIVEKRSPEEDCITEATIKLRVNGGEPVYVVAEGDGPVNALDSALRKAIRAQHPEVAETQLTDFKVRILDPSHHTAAKTRVLIESTDGHDIWSTVGVSENIIEAAWRALEDSIEYKLMREADKSKKKLRSRKKKS